MNNSAVDILLIEDNPHDAELTLHALKTNSPGCPVGLVRDGVEALEFLFCTGKYETRDAAQIPRVVILDLKLPKVDGLEVLRRMKAHPRTRSLPVVVLTSSREERDVVESYRLGVNSYLVKPIEFEQFKETVSSLALYWLFLNQSPNH